MNRERRAQLAKLRAQLETLRGEVAAISEAIEEVRDGEADALEAMPDSLKEGERGQAMQAAIDQLEEAASDLDSFGETVDDIASKLEEAAA